MIMSGFIAYVNTSKFSASNEVNVLKRCELEDAMQLIEKFPATEKKLVVEVVVGVVSDS